MLKTICLLSFYSVLAQKVNFENKVITTVRHGIEKNLDYIEKNLQNVNIDCLFGVVLTAAVLKDAYQNDTHVMDKSSLQLINASVHVLKKGIPTIGKRKAWITKYILDYKLWEKKITYKFDSLELSSLRPNFRVLQNIIRYQNLATRQPTTDVCLQDIINNTITLEFSKCVVDENCWKSYYVDDKPSSGYLLTHKLLLLQVAIARKCLIEKNYYEKRTKHLCQLIYLEIYNGEYFNVIDDMFDLFLEEIFLCGYEGYTEFFKLNWLFYIIRSQKSSGCFPANPRDELKTRIRRDANTLEDGCSDHTTGLGAAVLSLYYNFITKENIKDLN